MVGLPSTQRGQFFLAAYDPQRSKFGGTNATLLELALRAAGLCVLYLQGDLIGVSGRPRQVGAPPATASQRAVWDQISADSTRTWAQALARGTACLSCVNEGNSMRDQIAMSDQRDPDAQNRTERYGQLAAALQFEDTISERQPTSAPAFNCGRDVPQAGS